MVSVSVPSVPSIPLSRSYTWSSKVPINCAPSNPAAAASSNNDGQLNLPKGMPCALGVDEAGRGPVLGPLVYGISYCPVDYQDQLKEIGFADSKALTAEKRDSLLKALIEDDENIGWAVRVLTPQDISSGMLRRRPVNLNLQSSTATILLISSILQSGVDLTQIFVDTVGDPESYKKLLQSNFPKHKHIEWVVTSKADSIYPIVGAASICAKVTRDKAMEEWQFGERGVGGVRVEVGEEEEDEEEESVNVKGKGKAKAKAKENGNGKAKRKVEELESQDSGTVSSSRSSQTSELNSDSQTISINRDRVWNLGSGYPGDPKTIQYLKDSIDLIFGFTGIVRFSWSTVKLLLGTPDSSSSSFSKGKAPAIGGASADFKPKSKACKVRWIDEPVPISRFFGGNPTAVKGMGKGMGMISEKEKRSREWRDGNERLKKERSGLWRDLGIGNVGPGGFGF